MRNALRKATTAMLAMGAMSMLWACEATVVAPGPPPPPGFVIGTQVDVVDTYGYHHHGYYDDHHGWHGGYYDSGHVYHADRGDWHR
jgi:hypothetical protein